MATVKQIELDFIKHNAAIHGRLSLEELDAATEIAETVGLPLQRLLMRLDRLNSEIRALSFLAHSHWQNNILAGKLHDTSEYSIMLALIMDRIHELSDELGSNLVGIGADSALNLWPGRNQNSE